MSVSYDDNHYTTGTCDDRDETIDHISECSKFAQKEYKTRQDWVGKVINWELCKKFKFDHMNIWYMHNPELVLENETYKLLRDFVIQMDPLISRRLETMQTTVLLRSARILRRVLET